MSLSRFGDDLVDAGFTEQEKECKNCGHSVSNKWRYQRYAIVECPECTFPMKLGELKWR